MHLINATKLQAGYTTGTDKNGREWLIVVAKGTYGIPEQSDCEPPLLEEQQPLVMTDVFTGEPGFSALLHEIDFAPRKPRSDVMLNGSAYAPRGSPTDRVTVSLRVGGLTKSFDVIGNRVWQIGLLGPKPSQPEPFTVLPISYNNAFGGVDKSQADPAKHRWYPTNHAGVGYHEFTMLPQYIDGKPLPNTEETRNSVTSPKGSYRPMAFGPLGRAWQPRIKLAGTYDQKWLDEKFPFLPDNFDERYFQSAPEDQQTAYFAGSEEVELLNLTPRGRTQFRLPPRLRLPIVFYLKTGESLEIPAVADTILLEPDQQRFLLSWRASLPLRRSIREVAESRVGKTADEWDELERRERRQSGKQRHSSLDEWVRAQNKAKS